MIPLRVDCLALCDVEEARRFYESRRTGLGHRFAETVADAIERIADNPLLYQRIWREYRKCRVPHFPYGIIFRFNGGVVDILVVMDLRRRPGYWKSRLDPASSTL